MTDFKKEFIPEITVNNSKISKVAVVDGVEQEIELPAQEGFNISTRDSDGNYNKSFFVKELEGVILLDRYKMQSKYGAKPQYYSNEFEFMGPRNYVRVTSKEEGTLYEGDYAGAKKRFSTGQLTITGREEKTYDIFSLLYILFQGEVFKVIIKMNQNNNWFAYKDGTKVNKESRVDTKDYRGVRTKFALTKKKIGTNDIWFCNLQNVGQVDRKEVDKIGDDLEKALDEKNAPKEAPAQEDNLKIENIPF